MTRKACAHIHHAIAYLLEADWPRARVEMEDALEAWDGGLEARERSGLYHLLHARAHQQMSLVELRAKLTALVDGKAGTFE